MSTIDERARGEARTYELWQATLRDLRTLVLQGVGELLVQTAVDSVHGVQELLERRATVRAGGLDGGGVRRPNGR